MSKRNADMLIVESVVANEMGTMVPKINRRQARELSRVEPEQRTAVVERAMQATGGKITAAALKEATVYPLPPIKPAALAAGVGWRVGHPAANRKLFWEACFPFHSPRWRVGHPAANRKLKDPTGVGENGLCDPSPL